MELVRRIRVTHRHRINVLPAPPQRNAGADRRKATTRLSIVLNTRASGLSYACLVGHISLYSTLFSHSSIVWVNWNDTEPASLSHLHPLSRLSDPLRLSLQNCGSFTLPHAMIDVE